MLFLLKYSHTGISNDFNGDTKQKALTTSMKHVQIVSDKLNSSQTRPYITNASRSRMIQSNEGDSFGNQENSQW